MSKITPFFDTDSKENLWIVLSIYVALMSGLFLAGFLFEWNLVILLIKLFSCVFVAGTILLFMLRFIAWKDCE